VTTTIVVNETAPWTVQDYEYGLLNGSESMVVEFARNLAQYETVNVYCSCNGGKYTDFPKNQGGVVNYWDRKYLHTNKHKGNLIAFKDAESLLLEGFDKKYLWTADPEILTREQRAVCDGLYGLGPWHKQELKSLNIGFKNIDYVEPGVLEEKSTVERIPKQCLYASSPDRGLDYLESIWPEVLKYHPDATLVRTYSKFKRRSNQEMVDLYHQSDILAYPCNGGERYCITAIKAQMYGTIPCVIDTMALQDTVQFGKKSLKKDYLHTIIDLLDDVEYRNETRKQMMSEVRYSTWDDVVARWRQIIG
jgi:hypothetical protein